MTKLTFDNTTLDTAVGSTMYSSGTNFMDACYRYIYPEYTIATYRDDSFRQAFKVVSMLVDEDHLKGLTLRKFIELVRKVEKEL